MSSISQIFSNLLLYRRLRMYAIKRSNGIIIQNNPKPEYKIAKTEWEEIDFFATSRKDSTDMPNALAKADLKSFAV